MNKPELSFDSEKLLTEFQQPDFAMAYGSGVIKQEGYSEDDKPMIDFVFGAGNTAEWHTKNLEARPQDYSPIARFLGPRFINYLQKFGAGIYYNPYCDFDGDSIKYGVISTEDIVKDLTRWTHLYVAGRLQKPVQILSSTEEITQAINANLNHALNTALLLLPENFTEKDLYTTIAGLSYTGDSRMKYGENPKKVQNIVGKNIDGFANLYQSSISNNQGLTKLNDGQMQQDTSLSRRSETFDALPIGLTDRLKFNNDPETLALNIRQAVAEIVNGPSKAQTVKGFFTAGMAKSIRYTSEKIRKAKG